MKHFNIFLTVAIFLTFVQVAKAQADKAELKATIMKTLVQTDTYLTDNNITAYSYSCREKFHKNAMRTYKKFEEAYGQLKPYLSSELNEQIADVNNIYNLLAKEGSFFQNKPDPTIIINLAICSVKVEKIIKSLME